MIPVFVLIALLFVVLAALQLWFYRQGDARKRDSVRSTDIQTAEPPVQLKSPKLRNIWKNIDQTRALMKMKEKEAFEEQRIREKVRLGMPDEEEILFIDEASWTLFRPVAAVSGLCLVLSAIPVVPAPFIFLATGLAGLGAIAFIRGRKKYYLTNYRVLVGKRRLAGRGMNWSAVEYADMEYINSAESMSLNEIIVKDEDSILTIKGIKKERLRFAEKMIRDGISNS